MSSARSSSSVSAGSRVPTTLPRRMTVIRSAISRTSYSLWLMKMMLWPSRGEAAQDGEDLGGLLRGQDRGRLVEDEDPGLAVERLEDLDPLLPADRQGLDLGLGVDLEAEALAELDDPAVRLLAVEEDAVGHRLLAEEDVLGDGEHRHEHEVLVDHADAAGDRVGRPVDRDGRAVEQDLALVRDGQPVQDVHEGRLAGAVLAEQGVDLAGPQVEADVVVGEHAGIAFRDPPHLERRHERRPAVRHVGTPQRLAWMTTSGPAEADPLGACVLVTGCATACRRPSACTGRPTRPSCP